MQPDPAVDLHPSRELAWDLLDAEGSPFEDADAGMEACTRVLAKLHDKLVPLVGTGGYEILLGRATVVAARRHPQLGDLLIPQKGPPSLEALRKGLTDRDGTPAARVAERLVAEFLSFLARLVGWGLTLVLLRDVWPDVVSRYDTSTFSNPPSVRNEG